MTELDHLVVAARTLEEGAAWIEEKLGAAPAAGGKHDLMGTHNVLLALGKRVYLEVIAVDPAAPAPSRPRWFALDTPEMQEKLEPGPAFIHWAVRTDSIEEAVRDFPEEVEILSLSRGEYRWRIGVPPDGRIPCGGECPTLIQWDGGLHPADRLPDSGCELIDLITGSAPAARIRTPLGLRILA